MEGMKSYDDVFAVVGGFGKFQKIVTVIMSLASVLYGIQHFLINLISFEPNHWCEVSSLLHLNSTKQRQLAIPWDKENSEYSSCEMFDINYDNYTQDELENFTRPMNASLKKCAAWVFDNSSFQSTMVTEVKYSSN